MLVLHIGLPKTATTFLQHKIFKPAVGRRFLHRRVGRDGPVATQAIRDYLNAGEREAASRLAEIIDLLRPYAGPETTVVTDEGISINKQNFWSGQAPTPANVAGRLGSMRSAMRDLFPETRVVVGIRRQDSWLASRYAQSSKSVKDFSQDDFDRRALDIAANPAEGSSIEWLDYDAVRSHFIGAFGEDNVYFYSMERLREEPDQVLAELGSFVGGLDLVAQRYKALASGDPLFSNILSTGEDTWTLAGDRGMLRLHPETKSALIARFADSNEALGRYVDLRFD